MRSSSGFREVGCPGIGHVWSRGVRSGGVELPYIQAQIGREPSLGRNFSTLPALSPSTSYLSLILLFPSPSCKHYVLSASRILSPQSRDHAERA
jgi:hypothetical protein